MGVHATEIYPEIKKLLGIPTDEPIFILRAQDDAAVETIEVYKVEAKTAGSSDDFIEDVDRALLEFENWRLNNADLCKVPD